jgi:uncharacterized RDD family membrane protein YckC
MTSSGGLTPGDPLGGGDRPETADRPLWSGDRAPAPERPVPGYTSPVPPGAGGLGLPAAPGAVAGRPQLAGWWRRAGAQVVDGLIVTVGAALLFVAITAPFSIGFFASDEVGAVAIVVGALLAILCVAVVALLYAPALMARTNGKTLGRMATGIRVVRTDGRPITFGFAMLREVAVKTLLVGIASTLTGGIAYLLDVLWPLWDEENRALHDFVVNTRTVMD